MNFWNESEPELGIRMNRTSRLVNQHGVVVLRAIMGFALFTACWGCDPPQVGPSRSPVKGMVATTNIEHLAKAYELLDQADDMPEERVVPELIFYLNQWCEEHPLPEKWQPDPLVERLPRSLRQFITVEVLEQPVFDLPDVHHLQEALLLREVSQWAVRRPVDEKLESWIRSPERDLSSEDAEQLVLAARLFDWTIRNIQLDELLTYPKDDAAGPSGKPGDQNTPNLEVPAPLRAVPGPGYQREPLQTLLVGHGDALERARLFILLARQHHLDVVMLAVFDVKSSPRPRPWVPAVVVGDRLYLFDTFLGLPLPASEGDGIATLDAIRKDPKYFDSLQADEQLRYPFRVEDLGNLMALIDASPLSLTRRMQALEPALVGEQQLTLTVKPSVLADRVRKLPGINNVAIWPASWEAPLYRAALMQQSRMNPGAVAAATAEEALLRQVSPIGQGRRRHLRGEFENEDRVQGAKALYIGARVPDEVLARLSSDTQVQRQMQMERPEGMSDEAWKARIAAATFFYREAKTHANYWLGLVHQESEHPEVAIEWLKTRTLEATPPSRWQQGARYNLARCYERMGKTEEARQLYLADDSPQRLGNLMRARMLATRAAASAP